MDDSSVKFRRLHDIFSNILIVIASAYLMASCAFGVDVELYMVAFGNEILKNLDIFKSIRGGDPLEPINFVNY